MANETPGVSANVMPDQGRLYTRWKWQVLIATMACYLFYYCGRFNLSIALKDISEEFSWSNAKVYGLTSILILTYGFGQFVNGNLGDRFGRVLMPLGAIVSCLCNWMFSFAPRIGGGLFTAFHVASASALIFGTMSVTWAVNGYFQAMGMAPGGRLISNWWTKKERGRAMGFYTFAAGMSNVTVFMLAGWIADRWGWRWVFRIPPTIMAVVAVAFYLVTKDRPEDVGLKSKETGHGGKHGGSLAQYGTTLKHGNFMLACFSIGFHHVTRWGLLSMLPKFFGDIANWNPKKAGWTAAALPLGMAFGALSGGFISDKFFSGKRGRVILFSLVLCAICTVLIPRVVGLTPEIDNKAVELKKARDAKANIAPPKADKKKPDESGKPAADGAGEAQKESAGEAEAAKAPPLVEISGLRQAMITLMLLVAGFFLYVCIAPYFALCPDLLGVENAGTGIGVMDAVAYGFAAAGTATMGVLIDNYGYNSSFWFMAVCGIVGAVLILFLKEKRSDEPSD